MLNRRAMRGVALGALLALLLMAPGPATARPAPPAAHTGSAVGVAMAVLCGASINIGMTLPYPIVWTVGGAACLFALVDALMTPDSHDGH